MSKMFHWLNLESRDSTLLSCNGYYKRMHRRKGLPWYKKGEALKGWSIQYKVRVEMLLIRVWYRQI